MTHSLLSTIRLSLRVLLAAMLAITGVFVAGAQTAHSIDSLKTLLAKATTPADSVVLLHNLYDCYYFEDRKPVLYQIYETAERAHDYNSMLETLFMLTVMHLFEPSMEKELIAMAERAPESDIQKAYILYIKLRYQETEFARASETERQQRLHQALKDLREHELTNDYDRISCLYLICTNLRNTVDSKILIDYLQQLQELVEKLPKEELAIRTMFYDLSIKAYIENEMYDKALAATKRSRKIISQFDKLHESQGRIFRNYDGSLYNCYYNMLICGQELTDEEIDRYYKLSLDIVNRNPRINSDKKWQTATRIQYLMAKKHYAEAIPLLTRMLKENSPKTETYQFAKLLIKAARETGDKDALLTGSKIINSAYRERLTAKPDVRVSELQTIYDVENLKGRNRNLNSENRRMEIERHQQGVVAVTIAVIIVSLLLIWLISLYIRSRRLSRRLSDSNKTFTKERNSYSEIFNRLVRIRDKANVADAAKSNFVKNMSTQIREPLDTIVEYSRLIADNAKVDDRSYIRDYSNTMSVNTDLLIRLVNDILDLPQLENDEVSIECTYCSVNDICNFALEVIKLHVTPGVEVNFINTGHLDTNIFTDSQRVEQVLIQVLTNAAKFTNEGSITFGYEINRLDETITFTVTDTGIGIPAGAEEHIFDRFVKMDPTSQGSGLGLYIARLLATKLGGTLTLDSTYHTGARFKFTIPLH